MYYETGQSHVTALAFDTHGNVLAGTEPNGILYRISAKDKAFVLYNAESSGDPLHHSDARRRHLCVGSRRLRSESHIAAHHHAQFAAQRHGDRAGHLHYGVRFGDSQADTEIKPKAGTPSAAAPQAVQQVGPASPLTEIPGVDKSAIYKINADGTVETLWTSKDENVYSMAAEANGSLYFATDGQGRLYKLGADRKATLMVETNEGEATRLLEAPGGLMAATGDMGKLFRLADGAGSSGSYESPVHDSGSVARWGRITWRSAAGNVQVTTRTGNSARPDKTWSDWSEPLTNPQDSLIRSPNARYIQWRASLDGARRGDRKRQYRLFAAEQSAGGPQH